MLTTQLILLPIISSPSVPPIWNRSIFDNYFLFKNISSVHSKHIYFPFRAAMGKEYFNLQKRLNNLLSTLGKKADFKSGNKNFKTRKIQL